MLQTHQKAKYCLVFSLVMLIASATSSSALSLLPESRGARVALVLGAGVFSALWVRLKSKGTAKWQHYKCGRDFFDLFKIWNIFTKEYWESVNKYVIGREFSLYWVKYEKEKDGKTMYIKDRAVKSRPFGFMGCFDAYVLIQLAKLINTGHELSTIVLATSKFVDLENL